MANYCFVLPILAGGADKMRSFINEEIMTYSSDPFATSLIKFLTEVHGFDFSRPVERNEPVLNWGSQS